MKTLSIIHALAWLLMAAAGAVASDSTPQIWLVSTRSAPHDGCLDESLDSLCYWRMEDGCRWVGADAEDFHATDDPALPTVVFVHGNRTDSQEAISKGMYTYEIITSCTCDPNFRYVIWSWAAEKILHRVKKDTRLKVCQSDAQSYYLAHWLNQLRPDVKISLIGHSFGPRIITGGLHLLGGGSVAGREMPENIVNEWSSGQRNSVRVVLLAAAMNADWLRPGGCHSRAVPLIDQMLITRNGCDRVLQWYPRLYGRRGPQAMGYVGPYSLADNGKVRVIDVSGMVGKIHDWRHYCAALPVCNRWSHYLFLDDPSSNGEGTKLGSEAI